MMQYPWGKWWLLPNGDLIEIPQGYHHHWFPSPDPYAPDPDLTGAVRGGCQPTDWSGERAQVWVDPADRLTPAQLAAIRALIRAPETRHMSIEGDGSWEWDDPTSHEGEIMRTLRGLHRGREKEEEVA